MGSFRTNPPFFFFFQVTKKAAVVLYTTARPHHHDQPYNHFGLRKHLILSVGITLSSQRFRRFWRFVTHWGCTGDLAMAISSLPCRCSSSQVYALACMQIFGLLFRAEKTGRNHPIPSATFTVTNHQPNSDSIGQKPLQVNLTVTALKGISIEIEKIETHFPVLGFL